ncbi:hypothetical protein [Prevotella sp. OH937_COT-195]|uniref:hypothetical protein n=1 Tax=Prevotella sp. OH937_COT-195 TaxID=2491051 RepID=UPI000F654E50|nr:hypothetical protein [Prevotella sp. OH937_COT-195]RRD02715.1 hypothetical protein EII32_01510 [Prevotella sp. OH937_COT-195]
MNKITFTLFYRNRLTRWHLTMIAVMFLFSCENDSYIPPFEKVEYNKFADQLFEKEVNLKEDIERNLHEFGIESWEELLSGKENEYKDFKSGIEKLDLFLKLVPKYTIHGITYHTIDPNGNPVLASGVIYYPKRIKPKGVILISPTLKTKGGCGTDMQLAYEAFPGLIGYVCIIPDGIGLGTTSHLPIAFMQHDNTVRISIDMQIATKEFLHNHYRYDMPQETFLLGYSLGGHGIWGVARYYQQHPELGFRTNHIFVGGGAYQPELAMETILKFDHTPYAVAPYIIWSFDQYENLGLDFTRIFKGKLLGGMPGLCNGDKSIIWTTSYLGTDVHEYMADDFLSNKEDPQKHLILEVLKKNTIPNDWKPGAKIHLYHSSNDSIVPTICGDRLNDYLKSVNANVTYHKLDQSHYDCFISMTLDFFNFLRTKK